MKISGIITFILLLLLGVTTLVSAMGMEVVLDSAMYFIFIAVITIVLSIIIFISAIKEAKKIFLTSAIITVVFGPIGFIVSRIVVGNDYRLHRDLINSHDFTLGIFAITMLICLIMGIINIAVGVGKNNK